MAPDLRVGRRQSHHYRYLEIVYYELVYLPASKLIVYLLQSSLLAIPQRLSIIDISSSISFKDVLLFHVKQARLCFPIPFYFFEASKKESTKLFFSAVAATPCTLFCPCIVGHAGRPEMK